MSYFNLPSGSGIEFPRAGKLFGFLADFLSLKGYLRESEEFSYKTAQRALSVGDIGEAIFHARWAVHWMPNAPEHRYNLGCYLGMTVHPTDHRLLDEALEQLEEARRLAPAWDRPPTEIGIVLCNAGFLNEAEEAFRLAEETAGAWDHFHHARGVNHYHMKSFELASQSFRRCLELNPRRTITEGCLLVALEAAGLGCSAEAELLQRSIPRKLGEEWREQLHELDR